MVIEKIRWCLNKSGSQYNLSHFLTLQLGLAFVQSKKLVSGHRPQAVNVEIVYQGAHLSEPGFIRCRKVMLVTPPLIKAPVSCFVCSAFVCFQGAVKQV